MSEPFPLYHWSPTERRGQITRRGLVPGSRSRDGAWKPPFVCFSDSPSLAWSLSGGMRNCTANEWDLWMMWSNVPTGYEEIYDSYSDSGRAYIKEFRVYERVFKRDLWWVATRRAAA